MDVRVHPLILTSIGVLDALLFFSYQKKKDKSGVTLTGSLQGLILTVSVQGQGLVHHLKAVVPVTWRKQVHTKLMYVHKTVQTTENFMKTVLNTSNSHT